MLNSTLLLALILLTGMMTAVTEARFRLQWQAFDSARVALPVVWISSETAGSDLGEIQPGAGADFAFEVSNRAPDSGVSEVGFEYSLRIQIEGPDAALWRPSLFRLDSQGQPHPCPAAADGSYPGHAAFGTTESVHAYRLHIGLPAETPLSGESRAYHIRVIVTAKQSDF